MSVRLYVLVRALPDGRFFAASVDYPADAAERGSADDAVAAVVAQLEETIDGMPPTLRVGLGRSGEPELVRVRVGVQLSPEESVAEITVPLVVVRRETSGGDVFIGRLVGVPHFEIVVTNRADLEDAAIRVLADGLREWPIASTLALDVDLPVEFRHVDVALPHGRADVDDDDDDDDENENETFLDEFGDDLTARARSGRLPSLDRRDELLERLVGVLTSEERPSALLVGPRDVGKTTLVYELARRVAAGDVPKPLRGRRVWRIPANELIAGARYTGMWQGRARSLVADARETNAILFMGDPVAIVDAGRWSGSDNNLGRFLKTYVESGDISVICEASPESLTASHLKEPSFIDAFQRIEIAEPSAAEGLEILRAASKRLADRLSVDVDESAVAAAVELTRRYEPYRSLPGKAVHLLDETARLGAAAGRERLEREDVVTAFASRSGLPLVMLSDDVPLDLDAARRFFEERVLGQQDAIESVLELLGVVKAALNAPDKPLGTFFFVGPTGVGKTELAKALAEFLFGDRDRLLRFDMGEYGLRDSIPRLIGTAWQDEDEGELTQRVRAQPFCVVLLDEIEKAHADVFDVLLGVLGEGRLTDSNGRTADFRNAIVIMTSNLGADRRQSGAIGFSQATTDERERLRTHYREQAEDFFRPEFVNRIDRFVAFDPLDRAVVRRIARREIGRLLLREGLVRRRLLVEVDDAAVDALAEAGFDAQYGARPLQRQIEQAVIQPLARLIVTKRPAAGDVVRIHVVDGSLAVELAPPPPTPEERREARRERRASSDRASTARAARAVHELAVEAAAEAGGPVAEGLRLEISSLVAQTQAPTFWDAAEEARSVMARIYTLERILDRLERLHGRAAGLVDLAGHAERTGDRSRVAEILAAVDEIADALELARLELHGAAAGGSGDVVVVRVTPIGSASAGWAEEVAAMYRSWAERTGREVTSPPNGGSAVIEIRGPATLELLAAEGGIHRRRLADRRELDARVSVNDNGGDAVVRVYEEGRRTVVRDPRTNARSTALVDVLRDGRIDVFLLEALRR